MVFFQQWMQDEAWKEVRIKTGCSELKIPLQEIGNTTVKLIFREAAYASMLQEQDRSLLAPRIMETLITADDVGGT